MKWLTAEEVAHAMQTTDRAIYRMYKRGQFRGDFVREIGNQLRFHPAVIDPPLPEIEPITTERAKVLIRDVKDLVSRLETLVGEVA